MNIAEDKLRELIVANTVIEEGKLKDAEKEAEEQHVPLSTLLVEKGLITDEQLGLLIADFFKVPFVKLAKVAIPKETLLLIPEHVARKQNIIVFAREGENVKLAMVDPTNTEVKTLISEGAIGNFRRKVQVVVNTTNSVHTITSWSEVD